MELIHRILSRCAIFTVVRETEALALVSRTTVAMDASPPGVAANSNPALSCPAETAGRSVDRAVGQCILGILDFMVEEFPYAAVRVGASP